MLGESGLSAQPPSQLGVGSGQFTNQFSPLWMGYFNDLLQFPCFFNHKLLNMLSQSKANLPYFLSLNIIFYFQLMVLDGLLMSWRYPFWNRQNKPFSEYCSRVFIYSIRFIISEVWEVQILTIQAIFSKNSLFCCYFKIFENWNQRREFF